MNEDRVANRDALESTIGSIIEREPRDYWADRLSETGIPWGDVNQLDDVLDHPQTEHLDLVKELETEDGPVQYIDNPITFADLETTGDPMPDLGEHTDEILDTIGYSSDQIDKLHSKDVV